MGSTRASSHVSAKLLLLAVLISSTARAQTFNPDAWVVNGPVHRILPTPNAVYIAGDFTHLCQDYAGGAVPLDLATGDHLAVYPKVNGIVNTCIPDGSGGWFLGGQFDQVGTYSRGGLAHILADGSVDPAWSPSTTSNVNAMVLAGSTLYIGGNFYTINDQPRHYLASLNASTGNVLDWTCDASYSVNALAATSTTLYVGGNFSSIGGKSRARLASIDLTSGTVTDWNPLNIDSSHAVHALLVSGSTIYAGGQFDGGNLAAFNLNQPTRAFDLPAIGSPTDAVHALAISGSTLYVGGGFMTVNGVSRKMLAAVSATSNVVKDWNPGADNWVHAITVAGTKVYAGGAFRKIGSEYHPGIVQLDTATTATTPLQCDPAGDIRTLAVSGSTLYMGGSQLMVDGTRRIGLAALDPETCAPTPLVLDVDGGVWAMAYSGSRVYVGGNFTKIGGQARTYLAALNPSTGAPLDWAPSVDQPVGAIAVSGSTVYIAGNFTTAGGQPRARLAALDGTTGLATAWRHDYENNVYTMAADSSGVFVSSNSGVLTMDPATGQTKWSSNVGSGKLALCGSTLYIGDNRINAVDTATGVPVSWFPASTAWYSLYGMSSMCVSGSLLGASESFHSTLLTVTGKTLAEIHFDGGNHAIAIQGSNVYVGGEFHTVNYIDRPNFAMFTLPNATREWKQYR